MINILKYNLEKYNYNIDAIYGATNKDDRQKIVQEFNDAEDRRVLILSYKTSSLGLNINTASSVIHFDRWWNPSLENQAEDRAHRYGRKDSLNIYKLITQDSIDDKIIKLHKNKLKMLINILEKGSSKNIDLIDNILEELRIEMNYNEANHE